ncbi:MAG: FKBP-type peptidyl-prolyl cis-trans isomerase [Actinomycetota bacterium]
MLKPISISWTLALLLLAACGAAFAKGGSNENQTQSNTQAAIPQASEPNSQASGSAAPESPLKTNKEKASYALGMQIGSSLRRQDVDVDPAIFEQGMKDAMAGGKMLLTMDEARAALTQLQKDVQSGKEAAAKAVSESNKKQGEAFLAANKGKPGVVTLPSGLQYKILKEGTGPKPTTADTVKCSYVGTMVDGTEFDSSDKHGGPATFPVTGVIKGWTEALQLMPVGSKWQLFIPPDLAYGDRGAPGGQIGPNATLIFEVDLLAIEPKNQ